MPSITIDIFIVALRGGGATPDGWRDYRRFVPLTPARTETVRKSIAYMTPMKGFLALTSVLLVPFCFIEGFLWYESFEGALYSDDGGPIYAAKDEDAFQILQYIPQHDRVKLDEAGKQTSRRILALGSGTRVRIEKEFYFDGSHVRSGFLLSPKRKEQMLRVFRVRILDGSVAGLVVIVPAERFHNYGFL